MGQLQIKVMTYDRSKVTELIKTSRRKLQALIKVKQIKVQLIVECFEKKNEKQSSSRRRDETREQTNKDASLKDNTVDSASKVFSFCVFAW